MSGCIFCKIVNKEISTKILFESENSIAFPDMNPKAPTHILFIPKKHIESLDALQGEDEKILGKMMIEISEFARSIGLEKTGYRIVNNMGKDAGQTVFHIHFHVLAGREFNWPPG